MPSEARLAVNLAPAANAPHLLTVLDVTPAEHFDF
jgi:hypothetical protein